MQRIFSHFLSHKNLAEVGFGCPNHVKNLVCPGPGGGKLISPGSEVSNSGTSSPYPGKSPMVECQIGEPPKFLGFEHFRDRKWGSRFSSGSIMPVGHGSEALTPNGQGMVSGNSDF